jgi:hypothetical protein
VRYKHSGIVVYLLVGKQWAQIKEGIEAMMIFIGDKF